VQSSRTTAVRYPAEGPVPEAETRNRIFTHLVTPIKKKTKKKHCFIQEVDSKKYISLENKMSYVEEIIICYVLCQLKKNTAQRKLAIKKRQQIKNSAEVSAMRNKNSVFFNTLFSLSPKQRRGGKILILPLNDMKIDFVCSACCRTRLETLMIMDQQF